MSFNEWKCVKVKDIAEIIFSGGTPSTKKEEFWNGKINWLSSGETRNKFIYNTEKKITQEGVDNSSTKLAKNKDIVIASAGQGFTRGQTSMCLIDTYINQSLICIRAKKDVIDPYYLFYNISSRYAELRQISDGHSIRGSLTTKIISDLNISLPTIKEQKSIAKVISDLDEKIETNNKINKVLEEMAQAIFKQWFVDFEFPNEEGKPYKSSGGEMVESELGIIPKGWKVKSLEEVCERINSGGTPSRKKDEYYGGDIPWLKTKELLDNFIFNSEEYITEKGLKESSAKVFPKNTILMAIYASPTVGKLGIASSDVTFNQAMCGMVINKDILCYEYLYLFLLKERINLNNLASGSAQQNLSVTTIKNYTILVPNITLINTFKSAISSAFIKIENNSLENIKLSNIRNAILPKLMSGEIRVPLNLIEN
ncbi:MAG: restriction endonuclease subunit S [Clostridium sp.]|uniref:restriction endonuclease subunit S n=1 Tax=Clostridium TaxID=1485 RepID=UPI0006C195EF|nr:MULTISPECIES: restriction endonuclease subunit S [Clostridium]MDU5210211.1 restriction endonuclease subunit S [Clostridium sp.]MDU6762338.1 restriction endonuclease subunit S [Clostridium sp.]CUO16963.1 restriction endonuclease S subunit [Clostridium paraputrificum]